MRRIVLLSALAFSSAALAQVGPGGSPRAGAPTDGGTPGISGAPGGQGHHGGSMGTPGGVKGQGQGQPGGHAGHGAAMGAADGGTAMGPMGSGEGMQVAMKDASGKDVGTVTLEDTPQGLLLTGALTGLPPGEHAIHVHEVGVCEAPFKTSGGHFNPKKKQHGVKNKKGAHAGDMPNLSVAADGTVRFQHLATGLTLKKGATSVLDRDGSSLMIHASADDHASDPAGNAGDRIACGVISGALPRK